MFKRLCVNHKTIKLNNYTTISRKTIMNSNKIFKSEKYQSKNSKVNSYVNRFFTYVIIPIQSSIQTSKNRRTHWVNASESIFALYSNVKQKPQDLSKLWKVLLSFEKTINMFVFYTVDFLIWHLLWLKLIVRMDGLLGKGPLFYYLVYENQSKCLSKLIFYVASIHFQWTFKL